MNEPSLDAAFWSTATSPSIHEKNAEDCVEVLQGFIDQMTKCGANPLHTLGMIVGMAELTVPMDKRAEGGVGEWLGKKVQGTKDWWNSPGLSDNIQLGAAKTVAGKADGFQGWLRDKVYNGDLDQFARMGLDWHKGNHMKALGDVASHLPGAKIVQEWAPYVVPGLATLAAGKMLGMGTGSAMALGAGVGAFMGGTGRGQKMYNGATNAVQKWLAAEPEKPAPKPTEPATKVVNKEDTSAHASGIKVPVVATSPVTPVVPPQVAPVATPPVKPVAPAPGKPTIGAVEG